MTGDFRGISSIAFSFQCEILIFYSSFMEPVSRSLQLKAFTSNFSVTIYSVLFWSTVITKVCSPLRSKEFRLWVSVSEI